MSPHESHPLIEEMTSVAHAELHADLHDSHDAHKAHEVHAAHAKHDSHAAHGHAEKSVSAKEYLAIGAGAVGAVAAGMIYLAKQVGEKAVGVFGGGEHDGHGHGHGSSDDLIDVGEFFSNFISTGGGGGGGKSHGGGHH